MAREDSGRHGWLCSLLPSLVSRQVHHEDAIHNNNGYTKLRSFCRCPEIFLIGECP